MLPRHLEVAARGVLTTFLPTYPCVTSNSTDLLKKMGKRQAETSVLSEALALPLHSGFAHY